MVTLTRGIVGTSFSGSVADPTAGTAFALPASLTGRGWMVAWQTVKGGVGTITALSVSLQFSMDNTNWFTHSTTEETAGNYSIAADITARFVRLYHTSRTGVNTTVTGNLLIA